MTVMYRRAFLATAGAALAVGVAGCTGDDDGDGDAPTATETPADGVTPTDTPAGTEAPTETPGDDGPPLGEWIQGYDSFAMEMVANPADADEELVMEGRVHQGDMYWRMDYQGQTMESYTVDGDEYLVIEGTCFLDPGDQQQPYDPGETYDPGAWEDDVEAYDDLRPTGTETIDGEPMYVYQYSDEQGGEVTYYVSQDTGYIRRVTFETGRIDYHSWGDVEPIEPPDMTCQSF